MKWFYGNLDWLQVEGSLVLVTFYGEQAVQEFKGLTLWSCSLLLMEINNFFVNYFSLILGVYKFKKMGYN